MQINVFFMLKGHKCKMQNLTEKILFSCTDKRFDCLINFVFKLHIYHIEILKCFIRLNFMW